VLVDSATFSVCLAGSFCETPGLPHAANKKELLIKSIAKNKYLKLVDLNTCALPFLYKFTTYI